MSFFSTIFDCEKNLNIELDISIERDYVFSQYLYASTKNFYFFVRLVEAFVYRLSKPLFIYLKVIFTASYKTLN